MRDAVALEERAELAEIGRRHRPSLAVPRDRAGQAAAPPRRTEIAAAASRAWAASSGIRRGVRRKAGPQMSTAAMTVPARVVDRRGDRVEPELVLADRRGVAAAADPRQLLEERLELGDRPLGVGDEAAADDAQDLALGQRRQEDLAARRRSGAAPPGRSSRRPR